MCLEEKCPFYHDIMLGRVSKENLWIFLYFLVVMEFEFRTSCLKPLPTTWAMPPVFFALVILKIVSCFLPKPTCTIILLFYISWHCHPITPSFFPCVWVLQIFCPGWPGTVVLPVWVFWVAWDDRSTPPYPAIGWDRVLWTFSQLYLPSQP
jgi:hypothetical protein